MIIGLIPITIGVAIISQRLIHMSGDENSGIYDIVVLDSARNRMFSSTTQYDPLLEEEEVLSLEESKIRMDRAKKELEESDRSVSEIAELVGYNDSQYFFKLYKRETGGTPQQYRRLKQ